MTVRNKENGSAHAVVIICLVLALITALGWIFYQNFIHKDEPKKDTELVVVDKTKDTDAAATYQDFRNNAEDGTGVIISISSEISKLTNVGDKLKTYISENVGKEVAVLGGEVQKQQFTIDRLQGEYAVGSAKDVNAYVIFGPDNGTGEIKVVAGTQNSGFACSDLENAKVPSHLVDEKCLKSDDSGEVVKYNS